jgi:hypothetical protein
VALTQVLTRNIKQRAALLIMGVVQNATLLTTIGPLSATTIMNGGTPVVTSMPAASGKELTSGSGWIDPTDEPAQRGLWSQRIGARYDCVQGQVFRAGELAYFGVHANTSTGVLQVSFSLNNGPWQDIGGASPNPGTLNTGSFGLAIDATAKGAYVAGEGFVSRWIYVDTSKLADGTYEIRTISTPILGKSRVQSMFFLVDRTGTLRSATYHVSPAGGGDGSSALSPTTPALAVNAINANADNLDYARILHAAAPNYYIGATTGGYGATSTWVYMLPESGVTSSQVVYTGGDLAFFRLKWVCCQDITFQGQFKFFNPADGTPGAWNIWLNRCLVDGVNRGFADVFSGDGLAAVYLTHCTIKNSLNGTFGGELILNTLIDYIIADSFHNPATILNSRVTHVLNYTYATGTALTVDGSDTTKVAPDGWTVTSDDVGRVVRFGASELEIESISGGKWVLESPAGTVGQNLGAWSLLNGQHPDRLQLDRNTIYSNLVFVGLDCSDDSEGQGINAPDATGQSGGTITDFLMEKCRFTSTSNIVLYFFNAQVNWYWDDNTVLGSSYWGGNISFTDCVIEDSTFDNTDGIAHLSIGEAAGLELRNVSVVSV